MLSHTPRLPLGASLPQFIGPLGALGVRVFFVISGFLITTLLLREIDREGTIHLPKFYIRRTLRIFPPYYAFLLLVWIAIATRHIAVGSISFWPAWTYTSNFFPTDAWVIGHSWSLSVEEQFYLVWPVSLALAGRRRATQLAIAMLILAPIIRYILYLTSGVGGPAVNFNFDFLAAGCCLALFWPKLIAMPFWSRRWAGVAVTALSIAVLLLHAHFSLPDGGRYVSELLFLQPFEAAALALIVAWCVVRPQSVIGRLLNLRPVALVGVLSYSIYLWQQVFFRPGVKLNPLLAVLGTLVAATASYVFVERPALQLRHRILRWTMPVRDEAIQNLPNA